MSEFTLEDCVILWDCSRSMVRSDFKPSRFRVAQKVIKLFIRRKFTIDPNDTIALIAYGSKVKKLSDFTRDQEKLLSKLSKKTEILGSSRVEEAISFAVQMLVKQIRKVEGKIPRIFIVTDKAKPFVDKRFGEILGMVKGLGIFIDVCIIGVPDEQVIEPLKKLSEETESEFAYFTNEKALFRAAEGFASKKSLDESEDYFNPEKKPKIPPLIAEIAVDLRRPSLNELHDIINGKVDYKCQICFQNKCPVCKSGFYACGRFCPSCGRPIHLHCAAKWAEQQDYPEKNIFRCPFCFFLLRVPKSVRKFMETAGKKTIRIIEDEELAPEPVKMEYIPPEEAEKLEDACVLCNNIFLGDSGAYKCPNCGAVYHENCFGEMKEKWGACRVCGAKIID